PHTSTPPLHDALPICNARRRDRDAEESHDQEQAPASAAGDFARNTTYYFGHGVESRGISFPRSAWERAVLAALRRGRKAPRHRRDRKSTRLNSSHGSI